MSRLSLGYIRAAADYADLAAESAAYTAGFRAGRAGKRPRNPYPPEGTRHGSYRAGYRAGRFAAERFDHDQED